MVPPPTDLTLPGGVPRTPVSYQCLAATVHPMPAGSPRDLREEVGLVGKGGPPSSPGHENIVLRGVEFPTT